MNEIEKIDYIHSVIKETLEAIKITDLDDTKRFIEYELLVRRSTHTRLSNSLDLLEDLREPYLMAIKNKINSGQF